MHDEEEKLLAEYFDRLFPILRSITGDGVRQSHRILGELLPLETVEVPTGTPVFDWEIPKEWVVREAYVIAPDGRRICDVARNNLHLVNYSAPFRGRIGRQELDAHLHSLPELPAAIPYVASYYRRDWGFCISHDERRGLPDGDYEVVIDTDFVDGSLTLSECRLPGESEREILITCYTCHPSMANNELSGPLVAAFLGRRLAALPSRRYSYRIVFQPETIGPITHLALRGDELKRNVAAGFVVTCVGIDQPFRYRVSRRGDTLADRAARLALWRREPASVLVPFNPGDASDERLYGAPGIDLPVGCLMRVFARDYPEYHSSADDRSLISFKALRETVDALFEVCRTIETNRRYRLTTPPEPRLSKHNLWPEGIDAPRARDGLIHAMMWSLHYADGDHDLLAIAEKSGIAIEDLAECSARAAAAGLLMAVDS